MVGPARGPHHLVHPWQAPTICIEKARLRKRRPRKTPEAWKQNQPPTRLTLDGDVPRYKQRQKTRSKMENERRLRTKWVICRLSAQNASSVWCMTSLLHHSPLPFKHQAEKTAAAATEEDKTNSGKREQENPSNLAVEKKHCWPLYTRPATPPPP